MNHLALDPYNRFRYIPGSKDYMLERHMTRMRLIVQLTSIAWFFLLPSFARAQAPLKIPKIDRELLKGIEVGSVDKNPSLEVLPEQPKDDSPSLKLTSEQLAELEKLRVEKEQPTFQPATPNNESFNPYALKGSEEAKALLKELPIRDPNASRIPVSAVDDAEKESRVISDAEREVHEGILKESFGSSETIWTRVVDDIYQGDHENVVEINRLKRILFADYLGYLNAVGLELASYEITLKASKEKANSGKCSQATTEQYEQNLIDSVQSDPDTFTNAYCNNICKDQSYFLERAKFAVPEGMIESCADKARKIYDQFNCNELGQNHRANDPSMLASMVDNVTPSKTEVAANRLDSSASNDGSRLSMPKVPGLISSVTTDSSRGELLKLDQSLLNSKLDFESVLQKQRNNCKRLEYIKTRTIWSAPTGEDRTLINTASGYDSMDPRWTTPSENLEKAPEPITSSVPKNNTCETDKLEVDHFQKLRSEYQKISYRKIAESLSDWPLLDENDKIKKDYLRLILMTSDQLFLPLIDDLEAQYKAICGSASDLIADTSAGYINQGGRKYEVVIKANVDDLNKPEEPAKAKEEKPETLASYFNQTSSLMDGFLDSILLGSDQTGPATIPEFRGAEIAKAVLDGKLRPEDISKEAAKGPTGRLAQDIVKQTEKYLANGEYQGFKLFAVQMAGGAVTGGGLALSSIVRGGIKQGIESGTLGSFSKVLKAAQKIIMMPMLEGGETGAIQIGSSVFSKDGFIQTLSKNYPFKFSEYYFKKLSESGRKSPFLTAKEILQSGKLIGADSKPGFFRYETEYWELIYNPATREVWHLQPIRR
jgi:hypothetical protein